MKKVLIFSLAYYPSHVSGAEVAIKEITDRITDIEFHMVTLWFDTSRPRNESIDRVHVHRVRGPKILFPLLAAYKARRLHSRLRFDALWAMMSYMTMPVMLAKLFGVRVPHILTLQDGDPYEKVFGRLHILPFLPLINAGFRTAAKVQAISSYLAQWPGRRGYRGDVAVVPNGASEPAAEHAPAVGDTVYLLAVGRLVHQKAIDVVIRALTLLPHHIHLRIAGDGPDRSSLESLARELGVASRVEFFGHVDRSVTARLRRESHIFVLPSRSEGQGISFASAMLSGLPIVATQVGGIADFLFDAKRNPDSPTTGWAVDVDNPEQIAEAVKEILAHPEATQTVVATAQQYAKDNFNWDTIAARMREQVFMPVLLQ